MEELSGFILAGIALTGSPGPNTLSLAAVGAAFGSRRGTSYMVGLLAGMIIVMSVIATGVAGVLMTMPGLAPVVTGLAVVYFVYLAYRIASAPALGEDSGRKRNPTFIGGVFLSLVNPKAYAAIAALFSGFALSAAHPLWDVLVKMAILTAIIALVNVIWLVAGSALTGLLHDPRASRLVNILFAGLLLVSMVFALLV